MLRSTGSRRVGFSSCGAQAYLLCGMWDLPRPGLEHVSPALAGRFLTTAPQCSDREALSYLLTHENAITVVFTSVFLARLSIKFLRAGTLYIHFVFKDSVWNTLRTKVYF